MSEGYLLIIQKIAETKKVFPKGKTLNILVETTIRLQQHA
ncbi:hypothetical protein ADIWIN_0062 [Winogradskyella psychrotolerans RS-3]|uniref:Uncharacterized protein n=1 Tax=Winogradskyella psychrotolerans RS-3 TaxID=641526 RepID=S7VXC5_9FLAO|nr:hypothetical protein ADIWIN_0062 [Winogradskyella psychrotolerans RS-3]